MAENKVEEKFDAKDVEENKAIACLSYIGILFLIPLLAKKESKFCQANAKQGMALFICEVILAIIPYLGWLAELALIVVAIICIINTLQGKLWQIPGLYNLSKKWNF
ncbi:MAG: hypothetical protein WC752_02265 [Patescibacteria group bacterium]|jgi:uncharacterized membrane protein